MPAAKKRTEVYVGVFIFTGLILLGGLVVQFGRFGERWRGHYPLTVVFDDASGVIKGSEVRMGGAKIGKVSSLPELNDAVRVEVELAIDSSIGIPAGSSFQISSATLLGDKLIVVTPPATKTSSTIEPDSVLEGAGLTGFDAIQSNAERLTEDVVRIVKEAEATFSKVDEAVMDIKNASTQMRAAMDKINTSMLSDQNLERFDSTLENFASAAEKWNAVSGKFEPTLEEARGAIAEIQQAAAGAETTLASADQAIKDLKPSLDRIPKAVDEFASTSRKAGETFDRVKRGEGLLGALASDNDVAVDAKTFMRNLKEYGILRYKNRPPALEEKKSEAGEQKKSRPRFSTHHR